MFYIKIITDKDIKNDYKIYCEQVENPISFKQFEKSMKNTIGYGIYALSEAFDELKDELYRKFVYIKSKFKR